MIETSLQQSEPVVLPQRPFGQQARSVTLYSLLTALMIITPMLLVFVPASLFHCAIRNGRRAAWITGVAAPAIAAIYMNAAPQTAQGMKVAWSGLAGVVLAVVLPSLAALPLVRRAEQFGRVLTFLLIGSAVGVAVTEIASRTLLSFSPFAAQVAEVQRMNAQLITMNRTAGTSPDQLRMLEAWTSYNTALLPAVMLIMISLVFILSLLMLGRLNAWRDAAAAGGEHEGLSAYLFRNFKLPDGLLFAFILGGLTPLASGMLQKVAANTLMVVVFLYILQGLAIFRFLLLAMGASFAGTALGWLLLAFLMFTGVGPLLLGLAGLFDPFFDFRHFKKRKDDSHESHSD